MDFSDVTAGTPKVLDHCLDLLSKPSTPLESISVRAVGTSSTPAKYASHPDIQFFSSIKKKHHFAYHKSKKQPSPSNFPSTTPGATSDFDPFSRDLLLKRLRSYSGLNWELPYFSDNNLNELFCSSHGWMCEPSPMESNSKNHLRCTGCDRRLVLRFNDLYEPSLLAAMPLDMEDIQEINKGLKGQYLEQIKLTAHASACPWRNFLTSVSSTYYWTPFISSTDESLISNYLQLLHKLYGNLALADHFAGNILAMVPEEVLLDLAPFIQVSNQWLLSRYFADCKENFGPILEKTVPPWAYILAAMGWDLEVQGLGGNTIPLLTCSMCNQRIFLQPDMLSDQKKQGALCYNEDADMDDAPDENALAFHKSWCVLVSSFDGMQYFSYFHDMLIQLEGNIGPEGQYQNEIDQIAEIDASEDRPTKKRNLDLDANLQKFAKLRKLYFADSES